MIGDTIEGENWTGATAGILLHPDVQIARRGDAIILSSGGVEIALTATRALSIEAAVWWPDMGVEIATRRITADLPAEVQTVGQKVSQTVAQTLQWTFAIVRRPT